jgi:hypothetical protein
MTFTFAPSPPPWLCIKSSAIFPHKILFHPLSAFFIKIKNCKICIKVSGWKKIIEKKMPKEYSNFMKGIAVGMMLCHKYSKAI